MASDSEEDSHDRELVPKMESVKDSVANDRYEGSLGASSSNEDSATIVPGNPATLDFGSEKGAHSEPLSGDSAMEVSPKSKTYAKPSVKDFRFTDI